MPTSASRKGLYASKWELDVSSLTKIVLKTANIDQRPKGTGHLSFGANFYCFYTPGGRLLPMQLGFRNQLDYSKKLV